MTHLNKEYFEKTRELLAIIDLDGRFEEVSKAWEKVLGWTVEEMKSKTYMDLCHPDDLQRSVKAAENYLNGQPRSPYFENRYLHKNGSYVWFQWDGYFFDNKKMYSVARDITVLKQKEFFFEEVQKIEKIACWKINLNTHEAVVSDEMYRIYELPHETALNFEIGVKFFPPETRDLVIQKAFDLVINKEPYDIVTPFITAKGNTKIIRITGRCVESSDGVKEAYGLFKDITEQVNKQNELDLQRTKSVHASKMASLGEMAANIAHEINNPLSLIQGRAEHLRSKMLDTNPPLEEVLAGLDQIQRTSERIAKIIKSLRIFTKSDSQVGLSKIPLKDIVEDFLGLCSEKLKSEGYKLIISNIPKVEIQSKDSQLSQVFLNLINNSVEAIQNKDEKWIKVDFEKKKNSILIKVIDSGLGIEKSIQEKIMEPFFTTRTNGSGLGLSISSGIIQNHSGKIYYDDKKQNTTFCIELPCEFV